MTTPISTSIPYASAALMREARDFRQLGDLVNDDNTRETTAATFDASTKVNRALMKASGMIEAAAIKGDRYSVADLQALTGASKYLLEDICVELSWWCLMRRRLSGKPLPPETLWAFAYIDELGSGAKIFGIQEAADAGVQDNGFMTAGEWETLGLATDQAGRMYGRRAKFTRSGSGGDFTNQGEC